MTWKYVLSETDDYYTTQPPANMTHASCEDLPESELQLRALLYKWMMGGFVKYNSHGLVDRLINKKQYDQDRANLSLLDAELRSYVEASVANKSAMVRILSAMPDNVDQKEYLKANILETLSA